MKSIESREWKEQSALLRTIAHPVRLLLLATLNQRSHCVKDLNALLPDLPQPQVSQHMGALRRIGLVASHRDGPLRCYYILKPTLVKRLLTLLRADHPERPRAKSSVQREALRHDIPPKKVKSSSQGGK
ncbi:winged helix-turn-helix transcriptional regulator [bacterium]|nr:winged helix-turn-helix transcriptional regulator [bacterium]